jgi:hypothetical protein
MTLRLLAEDAEDLQVISAALQDAVLTVGDIAYDPRARTLTVAANRYRWEQGRARAKAGERVRAALQFGGVLGVRSRNLRMGAKQAVLELLAVSFEPAAEPPGGALVLTFAGDGELRADVEALDALLADVSEPWPARGRPSHD